MVSLCSTPSTRAGPRRSERTEYVSWLVTGVQDPALQHVDRSYLGPSPPAHVARAVRPIGAVMTSLSLAATDPRDQSTRHLDLTTSGSTPG